MNLLITGATGFVGDALCQHLLTPFRPKFTHIYGTVRAGKSLPTGIIPVEIETVTDLCQRRNLLQNVDAIVHLAARVHHMKDDDPNAYQITNTDATLALAQTAAHCGVRRFVFLSSVKVHGEGSTMAPAPGHHTYTETDVPQPCDPYGQSKWDAEVGLQQVAQATGLEVVVLRPPLVYGPGVGANFLKLMKLARWGVPLPLATVHNARSLIYVGNLVDAITKCLSHPKASGQTFLISDGRDVSTPELLQHLAQARGHRAQLFPLPVLPLEWMLRQVGKDAILSRLTGSLTVNSQKIREILGWHPPYSFNQGIQTTVDWHRNC